MKSTIDKFDAGEGATGKTAGFKPAILEFPGGDCLIFQYNLGECLLKIALFCKSHLNIFFRFYIFPGVIQRFFSGSQFPRSLRLTDSLQ